MTFRRSGKHVKPENQPFQTMPYTLDPTAKLKHDLPPKVVAARRHMKRMGWSQRAAAPLLGVHHIHLALVLSGARQSQRLLKAILDLPVRES